MEEFSSEFGLEKCTTNIYNDLTIEEGIINFTKSIHADLIGITPDGLWRLGHIFKKNTTDKLMKNSTKVILSMSSQQPVLTHYFTRQLLKQTHATDLFLANMGSGRLTDGDARNSHSTGR
jgi:hypothetical protein